jgi:hypothetical protein
MQDANIDIASAQLYLFTRISIQLKGYEWQELYLHFSLHGFMAWTGKHLPYPYVQTFAFRLLVYMINETIIHWHNPHPFFIFLDFLYRLKIKKKHTTFQKPAQLSFSGAYIINLSLSMVPQRLKIARYKESTRIYASWPEDGSTAWFRNVVKKFSDERKSRKTVECISESHTTFKGPVAPRQLW